MGRRMRELLDRDDVRRLQEVLEDRPDALLGLMTADGVIRWVSPAGAMTILGSEPDDYVGTRGMDYVHPDDLDHVAGALARAVGTGASQSVTYRAEAGDGDWVLLRTVIWTVDGPDDEVLVVAISVQADQRPLGLSA